MFPKRLVQILVLLLYLGSDGCCERVHEQKPENTTDVSLCAPEGIADVLPGTETLSGRGELFASGSGGLGLEDWCYLEKNGLVFSQVLL